jgi:tRNA G26 N,N-dimethylase Trm1
VVNVSSEDVLKHVPAAVGCLEEGGVLALTFADCGVWSDPEAFKRRYGAANLRNEKQWNPLSDTSLAKKYLSEDDFDGSKDDAPRLDLEITARILLNSVAQICDKMDVSIRPAIVLGGPDKTRIKIVTRISKLEPTKGEKASATLYKCKQC